MVLLRVNMVEQCDEHEGTCLEQMGGGGGGKWVLFRIGGNEGEE